MQGALEGLPGVRIRQVDLARDLFVLDCDPAVTTVARIEEAVRALGYAPEVVPGEPTAPSTPPPVVDPATLPPEIASAFEEAGKARRHVLLDFFGPG